MSGVALRSLLGATLVGGMTLPAHASDEVLVAAPATARPAAASPRSAPPSEPVSGPPAALLASMLDALTHVSRLADAARADRDVIRLNCVDEKLTAVKGLVQISRALVNGAWAGGPITGPGTGASDDLAGTATGASPTPDAAVASGSGTSPASAAAAASVVSSSAPGEQGVAPVSRLGLDDLVIAQRKCAQLRAEADACIGVLSDYPGGTRRETIVDGPRTADPTTRTGDVIWLERPPAASPYQ